MKIKFAILLLLVFLAQQSIAQSDINKKGQSSELSKMETIYNARIEFDFTLAKSIHRKLSLKNGSYILMPSFQPVPIIIGDYSYNGKLPISSRLFTSIGSEQMTYDLFSRAISMQGGIGINLSEQFSIAGGFSAIKEFSRKSPYSINRMGVYFRASYSVNQNLHFNAFGQYATPNKSLPQTSGGGKLMLNF